MAKAVVLLFLLDSLPDFHNVINTTLQTLPGMIGVCDSKITTPVLQVIGKKLNLTEDSVEKLQHIDQQVPSNHYPSHKFQELSPETLNNVGFQDNSIQESYEFSIEKAPNFIEHIYKENYTRNEDGFESMDFLKRSEISASAPKNNSGGTEFVESARKKYSGGTEFLEIGPRISPGEFQENAPFLAAIFETVGNVTAQTCGGVVLSPNWVLTAASCVNVLGPFYSNSSNQSLDNYYAIVAGAKNPLKDGTIHQVTKIYLHPTPSNQSLVQSSSFWLDLVGTGSSAPIVALLKVEPPVAGWVRMMENRTEPSGVSRIYGWMLEQNETSSEMRATSLPAKQLSPAECKKSYGIVENNATLCLTVNETASNNTRMSSGCPVVVVQAGRPTLLAVALTDGARPLLATPLASHRDWLDTFMGR